MAAAGVVVVVEHFMDVMKKSKVLYVFSPKRAHLGRK